MRHSLFFSTIDEANSAENKVNVIINDDVTDIYQSNDGETGSIEVRFFTDCKLDRNEQSMVVRNTHPDTYALNCENQ